MKVLIPILIVFLVTLCFGQQYADTTMNINISISAPQEVINQVSNLRTYIEVRPQGQVMYLYRGMPLAEAEILSGTAVLTNPPTTTSFGFLLPANGSQCNVGVFGLDNLGQELVHQIDLDRYFLRSGVSGIFTLPTVQAVTDHDVYINVTVIFE